MVVPGNEEKLFNALQRATKKKQVTKAVRDEIARVNALPQTLPDPAKLADVDDLWEYLRLHVCQVTAAQKEHFSSVLTDACRFAASSTFEGREESEMEPWYQTLQTKGGYPYTVDMPEPNSSNCPAYTDREMHQFQACHLVYVFDKSCWSEWNMVRKPDDARGQSHGWGGVVDRLYTELMAARAAADADRVPIAIAAMRAEIEILNALPEQSRESADFADGYDVYRWILIQAHQVTGPQKRHIASILEAAIQNLENHGFVSPASDWRARMPTLQKHRPDGQTKYSYEFGKMWMMYVDQWLQ